MAAGHSPTVNRSKHKEIEIEKIQKKIKRNRYRIFALKFHKKEEESCATIRKLFWVLGNF